ncbi:hypothetical protein [Paenibacillus urinalis]
MKITHREVFTLSSHMLRDQTKAYGKEELEQMIKEMRGESDDGDKVDV